MWRGRATDAGSNIFSFTRGIDICKIWAEIMGPHSEVIFLCFGRNSAAQASRESVGVLAFLSNVWVEITSPHPDIRFLRS